MTDTLKRFENAAGGSCQTCRRLICDDELEFLRLFEFRGGDRCFAL